MSYATQQDLIDRFSQAELIQLTDDAGAGIIDAATMALALADADAAIDSYLVGRYTLPFATPPPVLVRLASDIARYYLYADSPTETVRRAYEDAVRLLERMASGAVRLGVDPEPATGGDEVTITAGRKVFTGGGF